MREILLYRRALALFYLFRLYTVVPVAYLSARWTHLHEAQNAPLYGLSLALLLAGGFAFDDYRDVEADRVSRPKRPIPAGLVTERQARLAACMLFSTALLLLISSKAWPQVALAAAIIVSLVLYSTMIKKVLFVKNIFIALWCSILPWYGIPGELTRNTTASLILAAVFLFITQKEIVADTFDVDGDRLDGRLTVAVCFGPRVSLGLAFATNAGLATIAALGATDKPLDGRLLNGFLAIGLLNSCLVIIPAANPRRVLFRSYLELQKFLLIGGCLWWALALGK